MKLQRALTLALVSLCLTALPRIGRAADEGEPRAGEPAVERFGGQIVLADLLGAVGAVVLAGRTDQAKMLLIYPLAAPAVHLYHGDPLGALGSLTLHAGAPVLGAIGGLAIASTDCHDTHDDMFCGLGGFLLGGLVGMATATFVDAVYLASVTHEVPRRARQSFATPTIAIAPRGGVMLGFAGSLRPADRPASSRPGRCPA